MKKTLLAIVILSVCSGLGFAESMTGKIGVGLRNDTFDVRYFINDTIGVHAGADVGVFNQEGTFKDTGYGFNVGGFYSKEITDGLMFQTGLTVAHSAGKDTGVRYKSWNYNPYLGAEFIYKGRFGLDFKVIPIQYSTGEQAGADYTAWNGGGGSLGAHLYF